MTVGYDKTNPSVEEVPYLTHKRNLVRVKFKTHFESESRTRQLMIFFIYASN